MLHKDVVLFVSPASLRRDFCLGGRALQKAVLSALTGSEEECSGWYWRVSSHSSGVHLQQRRGRGQDEVRVRMRGGKKKKIREQR